MKIENKGDAEKVEKALKVWRDQEALRLADQWTALMAAEQAAADDLAQELFDFQCGPDWLADRIAEAFKIGIGRNQTPEQNERWHLSRLSAAIRLVKTTGATITSSNVRKKATTGVDTA